MKIVFYSRHCRELKGNLKSKVAKLIEKIQYDNQKKLFICNPIEGYNTSTYEIKNSKEYGFECNCQGFQAKKLKYINGQTTDKPICSHIFALYEWLKRRAIQIKEEKVYSAMKLYEVV